MYIQFNDMVNIFHIYRCKKDKDQSVTYVTKQKRKGLNLFSFIFFWPVSETRIIIHDF